MDVQQLNKDLCKLLDKKIELNKLSYNDIRYDEIEEEIHKIEDDLQQKYGSYLEEVLYNVHDEYCPDTDVLLPIAYVPNKVEKVGEEYKVDFKQGVYVEADDYADDETKLVLLANPVRIVLQVNPEKKEVVWKGD